MAEATERGVSEEQRKLLEEKLNAVREIHQLRERIANIDLKLLNAGAERILVPDVMCW